MFCPKLTASRGLLLKLLNAGTLLAAGAVNAGGKERFCVPGLGVLAGVSGQHHHLTGCGRIVILGWINCLRQTADSKRQYQSAPNADTPELLSI
jgi:hypothetical protein